MVDAIQKEKITMNKFLNRIIWLIIIAPVLYLAMSWKNIPQKIAMHFDLQGNPDQSVNKSQLWILVGVFGVVSLLIFLLLTNIYKIDPKKHAAENKDRLLRIGFTIVVFMSVISVTIVHACVSEGGIKFSIHFVFAAIGFLWAILGNYMHNLKPNYFAGLRLPWTLENEENWRMTHLLAGKLWFVGGIIIGIAWLFVSTIVGLIITFALFLPMVVIPMIYSYRIYQKNKLLNSSK
jgi:uncharacterized membrane protein